MDAGVMKMLNDEKKQMQDRIKELEQQRDDLEKIILAADRMHHKVVQMKIDGWLDDEYDLPDQQELIVEALNYNQVRFVEKVKAISAMLEDSK